MNSFVLLVACSSTTCSFMSTYDDPIKNEGLKSYCQTKVI